MPASLFQCGIWGPEQVQCRKLSIIFFIALQLYIESYQGSSVYTVQGYTENLSSFIWHVSLCPTVTLPRLWAGLPASNPQRMWLESPAVTRGESKDTAWDLQKLSLGSNSATPHLQHHAVTALRSGASSGTWAQYSLVWICDASLNSHTSGDAFGTAGVKGLCKCSRSTFCTSRCCHLMAREDEQHLGKSPTAICKLAEAWFFFSDIEMPWL